jgi:hypothetical protein
MWLSAEITLYCTSLSPIPDQVCRRPCSRSARRRALLGLASARADSVAVSACGRLFRKVIK